MIKVGDHVFINGTEDHGLVKHVHPHELIVAVQGENGTEERRYAHESVRLDPTMNEASGFVDH